MYRFLLLLTTCASLMPATCSSVRADMIKLKNGGELRGELRRDGNVLTDPVVDIKTIYGSRVRVERTDIEFLTTRSQKVERYETRLRRTPQTVSDLWDLAEWCRTNGMMTERNDNLNQILELDPDHEPAHKALKHVRRDGQWMTRDEWKRSQGYVKHRGRYITTQELELIEKTSAERERESKWYKKVKVWHARLRDNSPQKRQTALDNLRDIDTDDAVAAVAYHLHNDNDRNVRLLMVELLAKLPGKKPIKPLVEQSLQDVELEIRRTSLESIPQDRAELAMAYYIQALRNSYNRTVQRAAAALASFGDPRVAPYLIEALVTTHRYKVRVRDNSGRVSFNANGGFSQNGSGLPPEVELRLRAGQYPNGVIIDRSNEIQITKVVNVTRQHQNAEVLKALQTLTEQSFGYDQRTWRLWWTSQQGGLGQLKVNP